MTIVLYVILAFLHFNLSQAAIAPSAPFGSGNLSVSGPQVPFFKSPQSRFPSGSTSLEYLEKNQLEQVSQKEAIYQFGSQFFSKAELKPLFPNHLSQKIIERKSQKRWLVLETKIDEILAFDSQAKTTVRFPVDEVSADPYDQGFVLTLKDVFLKDSASEQGKVLTTVPGGSRFSVLQYKSHFAKVSYKTYIGYIPVSEIITKFDFSTHIYAANKWHFVKKRVFDSVLTTENKLFHFNDITGLITPDSVGLVASKNQKLPLWSRVIVNQKNRLAWIQSKVKGHGLVWWKPLEPEAEKVLTTDELLKRDVASISFHPKNPLKAIVSSHGVFMTDDGFHWKELSSFGNFHGPVHYFNDQTFFVGNYRSSDLGKTFENYIQIDRLTAAIQSRLGFLPKKLQVKKIETVVPFQIKIEIDTGYSRVKMQTPLFTQNWVPVKS